MRRLLAILGLALAAQALLSITSPRPLNDASIQLEHTFGKPVTYEEAVRVWPGELAGTTRKWGLFPKMQTFQMPTRGSDMESSVRETVAAFHQSSDGIRFDILRSNYGLHIVQRRMRDEGGALVNAQTLLDARITIPAAARTPLQHLLALGAAITAATRTKFEVSAFPFNSQGFNRAYKTALPPLTWGTKSAVARDALIDFLSRSPNKFSWRLNCQSSSEPADRFCALNLGFVEGTNPNGSLH